MAHLQQHLSEGLSILLEQRRGQHALNDKPQHYVTPHDLRTHWKDAMITSAFRQLQGIENAPLEVPDRIRSNFLGVFSLLVWIDRLGDITNSFMECGLTDDAFPLCKFPSCWHETPSSMQLYKEITEHQWKFFPFLLYNSQLYNKKLDQRQIIPISKVDRVQKTDEATVDRIHVDLSCVVDTESQDKEPVILVRKQYIGESRQAVFLRERRAYEALRQYKSPNLVAYFGSFSQTQGDGQMAYNLILQHIEGESLESFFKKAQKPRNKEELVQFWQSLSGALKGLTIAQRATKQLGDITFPVHIVHQDIKPSNFIVHRKPGAGLHEFSLVLIDFGYSFTKLPDHKRNTGIKDLGGGQTYGAPESSHHEDFTQNDLNEITAAVDVWSLGCVLSEACVWLHEGFTSLQGYDRRRTRELKGHASLIVAGHSNCFHNGYQRLQAVNNTHEEVRELLPDYDDITPRIMDMIEGSMLLPRASERQDPYALFQCLQSLISPLLRLQDHVSVDTFALPSGSIQTSQSFEPLPESSSRPLQPKDETNRLETAKPATQPMHSKDATNNKAPQPTLTYREAEDYIDCIKAKREPAAKVAETVQLLKANLKDRDFFYFIDTSRTMSGHQREARAALRLYGSLTKRIDQNGLELTFSSSPRTVLKTRDSTPLLASFDQQKWEQVAFEDSFSTFIDYNIIPRLPLPFKIGPFERTRYRKRISIFVFTDGRWGRGKDKACGIERLMENLIRKMTENGVQVTRTQISIQFMRFGDDEDGIRYLDYLDHLGEERGMDFVDTKRFDSDVYAMLFGPIHPDMDGEGEAPRSKSRVIHPIFKKPSL
ncbi:kinase-like protein [Sarocladium strictum]